jgi:hypothetical protein
VVTALNGRPEVIEISAQAIGGSSIDSAIEWGIYLCNEAEGTRTDVPTSPRSLLVLEKHAVSDGDDRAVVVFTFRGITVTVRATDVKDLLADGWRGEIERRNAAYLDTPAGEAESADAKASIRRLQQECDQILSELDVLDFSSMKDVLQFVERAARASDHTSVTLNTTQIVDTFIANGFHPNALVDRTFDSTDGDAFGRYIVGQVLDCWLNGGAFAGACYGFVQEWCNRFLS